MKQIHPTHKKRPNPNGLAYNLGLGNAGTLLATMASAYNSGSRIQVIFGGAILCTAKKGSNKNG